MALTKVSGPLLHGSNDNLGNYVINNITGAAATFTGNVSIGGTLTYDDVTNIDSVGLITARAGIHVNVSPAITIRDGTNVRGYIGFNANDPFIGRMGGVGLLFQDNKVRPVDGDTGIGTNNTVSLGEPTFKFKDLYLEGDIHIDSDVGQLRIGADEDLKIDHNGSNGFFMNGTGFLFHRSDGHAFESADGSTEYVRIKSDGKVGIGSASPSNTLVVRELTDNNSSLQLFRESTGGDIASMIWATNSGNQAQINYRGGGGSTGMQFYTGGTGSSNLRAIIDTSGKVGIGTNAPNMTLHVKSTSDDVARFQSTNAGSGTAITLDHIGGSPADNDIAGKIVFNGQDDGYNSLTYADIRCITSDVSNGTETAHLDFSTRGLGSFAAVFRINRRSTASAPSYTTDDADGVILDVYNTGNPYPRYMNLIAKSAGDTDSNIGFWTESVGGSPTEKVRITSAGDIQLSNLFSSYTSGTATRFSLYNDTNNHYGLHVGNNYDLNYNAGGSTLSGKGEHRFHTGASERLRIDKDGKLFLHGTNATGANNTSALLPAGRTLNIHGIGSNDGISVVRYSGSYGAYGVNIGRSRNDTFGTNTAVQDGDELGHVTFYGADGTNFDYAAQITGLCDGEVGTGGDATDMPGALSFRTTPEGSDTPTEKLRISSEGYVTKPNHPAFKVAIMSDASPNSGVVSEDNGFTLKDGSSGDTFRDAFNNGGHFDEATGRFTAPVTGLYFFHFSVMRSSNSGSGSIDVRIKRNTGLILARSYKASYSTNFESINVTTITNLDATHYVEFTLGVNMSVYEDDSYMLGYLIG